MSKLKPFTLALIQLGNIGSNKSENLKHAREMIIKAASKRPNLIVLPECFNSPYGHVHFPVYAENIGYVSGKPYEIAKSQSLSVKMLSAVAKETSTWLIGGATLWHAISGLHSLQDQFLSVIVQRTRYTTLAPFIHLRATSLQCIAKFISSISIYPVRSLSR